jgi:hypothetical protein
MSGPPCGAMQPLSTPLAETSMCVDSFAPAACTITTLVRGIA